MVWVNDLISFYKEFDDPRDQTSLVNNYCHVEDLTIEQGLEKLTRNTLRVSEQLIAVFADKDPQLVETLTRFMHGYITWHLSDKRYRINEIYEQTLDDEVGMKFRSYYEAAHKVGAVDPAEWTTPTFTSLMKQTQDNKPPFPLAEVEVISEKKAPKVEVPKSKSFCHVI